MAASLPTDEETAALLRDSASDFLSKEHDRERLRSISENRCALDRGFWQQLAQQGWLALRWPESLGGAALDVHAAAVLAEQLGRHLVPEPWIACAVAPAVLAARLSGEAVPRWQSLGAACREGESLIAWTWQDELQSLETHTNAQAEPAAGGFRLHARKFGVVGAALADAFLVTATLDGQPALWHVPRATPGVSVQAQTTSDGGSVGEVVLDGVSLPEQALLAQGPAVTTALERALDESLVLASAQLVGLADAALEMTLDYLRTRSQFGRRIGSFQAMQHAAVDARLQAVLARAAFQVALQRHAEAPGTADTRAAVAAAKARASDAALVAGRFGVQAHGAMGFAAESDIGLYLKAALRLSAWLGNGGQQRERHARFTHLHAALE